MGRKLNLSQEEKQKIVDEYQSGLSSAVVGKMHNISAPSVRNILKEVGIQARDKKGIKHCVHHRVVELEVWKNQEGTPDFDYFLGILATDGCVTGIQTALEFAENNREILEHYNRFLGNVCNINSRYCPRRDNTYYAIKYKNEEIVNYLSTFGIVPRKSNTLELKYINWNVLRGIFDGDGSLIQDKRCACSFKFKITSGSMRFIKQISNFYESNDISYYVDAETGKLGNTWHNIIVGQAEDIYKIYCNMYKDSSCFLHRKHDKFGPIVEKFANSNSVNSVNEMENSKTEPNLNTEEGAETRNGGPKQ